VRALLGLLGALVGLFAGLVGAFVQAVRWTPTTAWGQWDVPWGSVAAIVILVGLIRGAMWLVGTRWIGWVVFLGWILGTGAMAIESPFGDVALGAGTRPLVYLVVAGILGAFAATLPLPIRR
jgi:hypothetical protein